VSHRTLQRLRKELKKKGITHDVVADAAGVKRTLVTHLLAGRAKSQNVLDTIKRLLAEDAARVDQVKESA
jgi:transcriptional regulator with XRE-family HTH domain